MRESPVEQKLVKEARAEGCTAYKFTSPGRRNVPDRIVLAPGGLSCFVEVKQPGAVPTKAQSREHERLRALGFTVIVLDDPAEAPRIVAFLKTGAIDKYRPLKDVGLA